MLIQKNKTIDFRFGIMIHSVGLEIYIGWYGVFILWRQTSLLDGLPCLEFNRRCRKCGATDWSACNLDQANENVIDCNKCQDKSPDWSPFK